MLFEGFFVPLALEVIALGDFLVNGEALSLAITKSAFSDSFEASLCENKVKTSHSYSAICASFFIFPMIYLSFSLLEKASKLKAWLGPSSCTL